MKSLKLLGLCCTLALCSPLIARAQGVDSPSPNLPPADGHYVSPTEAHQIYTAATVDIFNINHHGFDFNAPPPTDPGIKRHETFNSILEGDFTIGGGPVNHFSVPAPVGVDLTKISGAPGSVLGQYQTEMVLLNINLGGVLIRESPSRPSLGLTTISDAGGGLFHIDSFFDIFTELSLDGGANWIPSDASGRVNLVAETPEPSSLALMAIGFGTGAMVLIRRRKKSQ
jgi:hypothetical protein